MDNTLISGTVPYPSFVRVGGPDGIGEFLLSDDLLMTNGVEMSLSDSLDFAGEIVGECGATKAGDAVANGVNPVLSPIENDSLAGVSNWFLN